MTMVVSYGQVIHSDSIKVAVRDTSDSTLTVQSKQPLNVYKIIDGHGKIIEYDSIEMHSLIKGNMLPYNMDFDSLMNAKGIFSKNNYSWNMEDQDFQDFFGTDSIFSGNRLLQQFFKQQGEDSFLGIQNLLEQIDSLQQLMMKKQPNIPIVSKEN